MASPAVGFYINVGREANLSMGRSTILVVIFGCLVIVGDVNLIDSSRMILRPATGEWMRAYCF